MSNGNRRFVRLCSRVALFTAFATACVATSAQAQAAPPTSGPPSGAPAGAQPPAARATPPDTFPPLPGPPIRRIESAQAISTETLGAISQVRALSDGRVMVNDGMRRRLLIFDSTLTQATVVLDSLTEVENAYGSRPGRLIPHLADSSLFIDPATLAMLVINPAGQITRVRAIPFAQHVQSLTSAIASWGNPAFDTRGRLVYRITATTAPMAAPPLPGMPYVPSPADSAFVVGVHLNTRVIDTLGVVRMPKVVYSMRMEPEGYYSLNSVPNPLPLLDEWAVMSDGSVAFVRGVDYRVEFRAPDGTMTSGDKLPYPWMRMDDTLKAKFADSAKAVQIKNAQTGFVTQMISWSNVLNKPYPASFSVPESYVLPPGMPADWILPKGLSFPPNYIPACPPGVAPTVTPQMMSVSPTGAVSVNGGAPAAAATGAPAGAAPAAPQCTQSYFQEMYGGGYTPPAPIYRAPTLVRPADIPDYKPPIAAGATRADADGNLWVRANPMRPMPGGQIFDVINRKGEMIDRIQIPMGFTLVGFGEGKVVYLSNRDAKGLHLSRVRLQ
jgi:hypothetical protein